MGETSLFICVFYYLAASITLQPSQPLLSVLNLSYPWVSVLPEGEEFLVMVYGFGCVALLFVSLSIYYPASTSPDIAKRSKGFQLLGCQHDIVLPAEVLGQCLVRFPLRFQESRVFLH